METPQIPTLPPFVAGTPVMIPATFLRKASDEDRPGEAVVRLPNNEVMFVQLAAVSPLIPTGTVDAIIEICAQAAEAQDRAGLEWVRESLWANILKRAGDNVRRLKAARGGDR
jgi:hypothetical protein